jgi:hypothetical protein
MVLLLLSCGYRKPAENEPVMRTYQSLGRVEVTRILAEAMTVEGIPVKTRDVDQGVIVSDSFDVGTEYADCGKNLLGAEYPGSRTGVLRIRIKSNGGTQITFDFETRLEIAANDMTVICGSYGILEEKLLAYLERNSGVGGNSSQ